VATLLGDTGHTSTNGVSGVLVCQIFSIFILEKMGRTRTKHWKPNQARNLAHESQKLLVNNQHFGIH